MPAKGWSQMKGWHLDKEYRETIEGYECLDCGRKIVSERGIINHCSKMHKKNYESR